MSYYHIIKVIFVNPQMQCLTTRNIPVKEFPDLIKCKCVNKFYHKKGSVVKTGEILQAFQRKNWIQRVSAYRADRKVGSGEKTARF